MAEFIEVTFCPKGQYYYIEGAYSASYVNGRSMEELQALCATTCRMIGDVARRAATSIGHRFIPTELGIAGRAEDWPVILAALQQYTHLPIVRDQDHKML